MTAECTSYICMAKARRDDIKNDMMVNTAIIPWPAYNEYKKGFMRPFRQGFLDPLRTCSAYTYYNSHHYSSSAMIFCRLQYTLSRPVGHYYYYYKV